MAVTTRRALAELRANYPANPCPKCQSTQHYQLGDGRFMCKQCRTKYTPGQLRSRLDELALHGLAAHFWSMSSIDQAARLLGLNRKTVQRYYGILREQIARHGESNAAKLPLKYFLGSVFIGDWHYPQLGLRIKDTVTVFGLVAQEHTVRIMLARNEPDWSGLDLSSIKAMDKGPEAKSMTSDAADPKAMEFWDFTRKKLRRYRGGFMKHFPLYLREMEFRYNHRHDPAAILQLFKLLHTGPN